jgi:hypothetical protein
VTHAEFCYWLQGFLELADPKRLTASQVKMIQQHLDLVFTKVTDKKDGLEDLLKNLSSVRGGTTYC